MITLQNVTDLTQSTAVVTDKKIANKQIKNIDATGKWLLPPLVDLCARLREPGNKSHGTLASEGAAAVNNGFLHVVMPPDTLPVLESGSLLAGLQEKAKNDGGVNLHLLGALTKGLQGEKLASIAGLKQGGCIGVTNARNGFASDDVLLRTLEYAASLDVTVFFYPNEPSLSKDGCVHEGYVASRHGLAGIPWLAETVALAKQILMVEETGVRAHFGLLTCKSSVELIAWAKAKGLPITADVAMHQLHLTDDNVVGFNSLAHVMPPLRSNTDQQALRKGLTDGVIDAICSHHEPLSSTAKQAPFAQTVPGISNFDTFMSLACTLVNEKVLTTEQLVEKICTNPAKIAGIQQQVAAEKGVVLVDPHIQWQVTAENMLSAGKNTPFIGKKLFGRVEQVFYNA